MPGLPAEHTDTHTHTDTTPKPTQEALPFIHTVMHDASMTQRYNTLTIKEMHICGPAAYAPTSTNPTHTHTLGSDKQHTPNTHTQRRIKAHGPFTPLKQKAEPSARRLLCATALSLPRSLLLHRCSSSPASLQPRLMPPHTNQVIRVNIFILFAQSQLSSQPETRRNFQKASAPSPGRTLVKG